MKCRARQNWYVRCNMGGKPSGEPSKRCSLAPWEGPRDSCQRARICAWRGIKFFSSRPTLRRAKWETAHYTLCIWLCLNHGVTVADIILRLLCSGESTRDLISYTCIDSLRGFSAAKVRINISIVRVTCDCYCFDNFLYTSSFYLTN